MHRFVSALLIPCLVASGCSSVSTQEHDTQGEPSMVSVKAFWEDSAGDKHLVGGLMCQLVRKVEGAEPELVAEGTTEVDELLLFEGLEPGDYRFVVRGGKVQKAAQEFRLRPGKRISVRIDVSGGLGETVSDVASALGEGAVMVAIVVGATVAVVTLVGVVVAVAVLTDDDDDDDQDPAQSQD